jgi:hypothetical protein
MTLAIIIMFGYNLCKQYIVVGYNLTWSSGREFVFKLLSQENGRELKVKMPRFVKSIDLSYCLYINST